MDYLTEAEMVMMDPDYQISTKEYILEGRASPTFGKGLAKAKGFERSCITKALQYGRRSCINPYLINVNDGS